MLDFVSNPPDVERILEIVKNPNPAQIAKNHTDISKHSLVSLKDFFRASKVRNKTFNDDRCEVSSGRAKAPIENTSNVLIYACCTKSSQILPSLNGKFYCQLQLNDMNDYDMVVKCYIFGDFKGLAVQPGELIAIKRPKNFSEHGAANSTEGRGVSLKLSVASKDQIVKFGILKCFSFCKSKTENGEDCGNFVNKNLSDYCNYHVNKTYKQMSKSRPSIASPLNFFMPKIMQQSLSNGNQSEDYNCLKFKTKSAGINSADFKKSIEGNLTPGARQLNQLLILKERREKNLPSSKISLNYNIHQGGQTDEHVCHTVSQNRATDSLKEFEELLKADSIFDSALQAKQQKTLENRIDELAEIEKNEIYMCNKQSVEKKCYKCVKCNYTAESISEFCKINNHTIQTVTRTKRFFKCNNCGKQLEILDRYPSEKCQKCNAYSWSKGSMWTKGDAKLKEALIIDDLTKINR